MKHWRATRYSSGRALSLSKNIGERGSRATPCNCCSREYHLTSDHLESGTSPRHAQSPVLCRAAGRSCRNLDSNLCGESWVVRAFHGYSRSAQLALVEGVMGLFDGLGSSEQ